MPALMAEVFWRFNVMILMAWCISVIVKRRREACIFFDWEWISYSQQIDSDLEQQYIARLRTCIRRSTNSSVKFLESLLLEI